MDRRAVIGVDIGTSSSKGVLVTPSGEIIRSAVREHVVDRPEPGRVEMSADVWWQEFCEIAGELTRDCELEIVAVGVSGMGPCLLLTDEDDAPLRPAILYGVDTRATAQIARLNSQLGETEIMRRGGSQLSSQAVAPKVLWVREHEPDVYARARRLFMPSSWLVRKLTGSYVLDVHSASQCTPLFDTATGSWNEDWAADIVGQIELPPLAWPGDVAGSLSEQAAGQTGLPAGIPVITGTIDAWSEAVSVGATEPGDLMLMYGTTMFLVNTVDTPVSTPSMWSTVGAFRGTSSLAGGMATSGAITAWLRELFGGPGYAELLREAGASGPGANGVLMLPYFAGERTPVSDPDARGIIAGLTVSHTRGDLYRAALEATAFGVRHNVEAMTAVGAPIRRVFAVGGGTQGSLWTQIVSDVTGLDQVIPRTTIGASFGAAFLAASAVLPVSMAVWNPPAELRTARQEHAADYDALYAEYLSLYPATADISHTLAQRQRAVASPAAAQAEPDARTPPSTTKEHP